MSHNLNLEVYEFLLKDYPFNLASSGIYNSIPDINVRTLSIESSDIDECGIVANEVKQDAIDEATTLPKDIFNPKREGDFINHNNIRSCDPIKSSTITNTHPISLNVDKEDAYKYSFNILGINSRDLIFYSSIYGAKNTGIDASIYDEKIVMDQKNDSGQLVIEAYFPSMIILYNDIKKKIIEEYHPELQNHNYDEVEILSRVIRDQHGIIIDPLHKTLPFITKYEKTRILGERATQLNAGAKSFIEVEPDIIDGYVIALKEFEEKKIPFILKRPLPNGGVEYWKLEDLEVI